MSVLGAIPTAQGLNKPDDLTALLKASGHQRQIDEMREERIGRDDDVAARDEHAHRMAGELREECAKGRAIRLIEHCEARKRAALAAVE